MTAVFYSLSMRNNIFHRWEAEFYRGFFLFFPKKIKFSGTSSASKLERSRSGKPARALKYKASAPNACLPPSEAFFYNNYNEIVCVLSKEKSNKRQWIKILLFYSSSLVALLHEQRPVCACGYCFCGDRPGTLLQVTVRQVNVLVTLGGMYFGK